MSNRMVLKFDDINSQIFIVALELLQKGMPLNFKDVFIQIKGGTITISIESDHEIGQINFEQASNIFEVAEKQFNDLMKNSKEFFILIPKNTIPVFSIVYKYGMGSIQVAIKLHNKIELINP